MELSILIVAIAALVILAAASLRYGAESRDGFREDLPSRPGFSRGSMPTGGAA
ncbi:MAG: hypothetical protein IT338_19305 [Thermomicrobiales bacterium]|nr:hypothetical protein [Thermomicrobiales bacterium]